jgi:hypothetical protein
MVITGILLPQGKSFKVNLSKTPYSTVEDIGKRENMNKGEGGES